MTDEMWSGVRRGQPCSVMQAQQKPNECKTHDASLYTIASITQLLLSL